MLSQVQSPALSSQPSESLARLKQENRDQDTVIAQLNERIHSLLQQRAQAENVGQEMAQSTLKVFLDELEQC